MLRERLHLSERAERVGCADAFADQKAQQRPLGDGAGGQVVIAVRRVALGGRQGPSEVMGVTQTPSGRR